MALELITNSCFDGRCIRVEARDEGPANGRDNCSAPTCAPDVPFDQANAQPLFHFFEAFPCQPVLHAYLFGRGTDRSGRLDRFQQLHSPSAERYTAATLDP